MLKTYHFTTFEFALSLHLTPVAVGEAQTSLDSSSKEDVTRVCAACTMEHMARWKAGALPPEEYFCRGCTSRITCARAAHASGQPSSSPLPTVPSTSLLPFSSVRDEEPWVCRDDLKGQSGDGIKLCCFCFLSQLLCLGPLLASKPTAASPVVSIQALKLFKLFAERCSPSVRSNHAWATLVKVQPQ